jgi:hypothetical protein
MNPAQTQGKQTALGMLAAVDGPSELQAVHPNAAPENPPARQRQRQHEPIRALGVRLAGLFEMEALTFQIAEHLIGPHAGRVQCQDVRGRRLGADDVPRVFGFLTALGLGGIGQRQAVLPQPQAVSQTRW